MSLIHNGEPREPLSPTETLHKLDDKIASAQQKIKQLKLQVLNEEKKLDKFLAERRNIQSALSSSSFKGSFVTSQQEDTDADVFVDVDADLDTNGIADGARPPPLRRMSTSIMISESPASPPPTTSLSPPPFKNRIFAGHTPRHPIGLSPSASEFATPLNPPKAPVEATLAPYSTSHRLAQTDASDLPHVEDDPKLEGPLTALDEGFLDIVDEKLNKVQSEEKVAVDTSIRKGSRSEERHVERDEFQTLEEADKISPLLDTDRVPVLERMEGIKLKAKRSTNFGVPLGQLR